MNGTPIVTLNNVSKRYNSGQNGASAVHNVSLEAYPGEMIFLLGPSGSGKTTLLNLIAGLLEPTDGGLLLYGNKIENYSPEELRSLRARRIGFVFQSFMLIDAFTALMNVVLVLQFAGKSMRAARRKAESVLQRLGISHLAEKFPPTLSQGEKQRVAIARAIANDADLILADEPTASLDSAMGLEIIRLLRDYANSCGKCVIVASHDARIIEFADRVIRLEDGEISETVSD